MEIDKELKQALITDVEQVCNLNLSGETKTALMRCFEITLGTRLHRTFKGRIDPKDVNPYDIRSVKRARRQTNKL